MNYRLTIKYNRPKRLYSTLYTHDFIEFNNLIDLLDFMTIGCYNDLYDITESLDSLDAVPVNIQVYEDDTYHVQYNTPIKRYKSFRPATDAYIINLNDVTIYYNPSNAVYSVSK